MNIQPSQNNLAVFKTIFGERELAVSISIFCKANYVN